MFRQALVAPSAEREAAQEGRAKGRRTSSEDAIQAKTEQKEAKQKKGKPEERTLSGRAGNPPSAAGVGRLERGPVMRRLSSPIPKSEQTNHSGRVPMDEEFGLNEGERFFPVENYDRLFPAIL